MSKTSNADRVQILANNVKMPFLGFGTYLISEVEAAEAVYNAIQAGYRHVDTAEFYDNERGVGTGIQRAISEGLVVRNEIFVTTKLWPGNADWGQTPKTTETTITSLEASLNNLQLDYVDLYLIHAPFQHEQRLAQWRGLVELQSSGKALAIGVSNFNIGHLKELEDAGLPKPQVNQIELHPWAQKVDLVKFLEENGIAIIAYSSLAPLSTWRTAPGHDSGKTGDMRADGERENSPFKVMAKKYGVTEAQVLLRWGVQKGFHVLPKSTNPERLRQNADIFSFELDAHDMALIATMDRDEALAWSVGDPTRSL